MRHVPLILLSLLTYGCSKDVEPPKETAPLAAPGEAVDPPDAGPMEAASSIDAEQPGDAAPPTLAQLQPSFRWLGAPGERPSGITVAFSEPVVARRHRKPGKTVLLIEPEQKGKLRFVDPYTLQFRFADQVPMDTTFKVSLRALETRWALLEGGDKPPTTTLKTPKFEILRSHLGWYRKTTPMLFIHASAPMNKEDLTAKLRLSGDGLQLSGWRILEAPGNAVHIMLPRLVTLANAIGVEITEGVRHVSDNHAAPAYSDVHTRPKGNTVSIEGLGAAASAGGFGIDIICHDTSVSKRRSWFWHSDLRRSFRVGPRCEPTADSRSYISVEPPIDFRLAPGRGGFRLLADFGRGTYRVRLRSGLRTVDGSVLREDFVKQIEIPTRQAQLEFIEKGRYLPKGGWNTLRFKHRNVGELQLEVRQIRPENLAFWLSDRKEVANHRVSDIVVRRALRVAAPADVTKTGSLDVASLIGDSYSGVLQVSLTAPGIRTATRLLVSDINLLAKRYLKRPGNDKRSAEYGYKAWALEMRTHKALAGVQLRLIAPSGRAISACITSVDGSCELPDSVNGDLDRSNALAIIAQRGDDLTYLRFSDLKLPVNQAKVGGAPFRQVKPYRAFLYGDRDLYRPGENVHLVAMLRTKADKPPKSGMPVEFLVFDARRRKLAKRVIKLDDAGLASMDLPLSPIASTGTYSVQLRVGDERVGTTQFKVEEFMPERMRASVTMAKKVFTASDPLEAEIGAQYLFGGSAKDSPVSVDCHFSQGTPKPKGYDNYSFAPWRHGDSARKSRDHRQAPKLDKDGKTKHQCKLGKAKADEPLKLRVEASVQEAGSGRTTRASSSALVLPEAFQLGIRSKASKLKRGNTAQIEAVVLDQNSKPVALTDKLTLTLFRLEEEYSWGYDEANDSWTYDHRYRLVEEGKSEQAAGQSKYGVSFDVAKNAPRFLIRAEAGNARSDQVVSGTGGRYWWSRNRHSADRTPQPERPVELIIKAPERTQVGQTFSINFEAPYRGRALLTLETDNVRQSHWRDITPGEQTWDLTIQKFAPNVYASLLLFKDPHLESPKAFVPGRAFGLTSIAVDPVKKRQKIDIKLPSEIRPNSELLVELDLGKGAPGRRVTIAAVDEGILSLTGFKTPDPIATLYNKRRLGVSTYETVGWNLVLPNAAPGSAKGGGAGQEGGASRIQPTKPVALWSGVLEVPIHGKLKHSFKVPRYRGSLKVMVVAAGQEKVGSAAKAVLVRDPLVLLATLPKQLSQGDRFFIPVSLTNLSGTARSVVVEASASSIDMGGKAGKATASLRFEGSAKRTIKLKDKESGVVRFEATALRAIGAAKLSVEAKSGDLISREELDVPFSPQAPRSRLSKTVELTTGNTNLAEHLTGWMPTTERSSIWVTTNPYGEAFSHLKHLIRYPYGCIEQTVSSSRPLLFAGLVLPAVAPDIAQEKDVPAMVRAGVERVFSMQTASGGFAYWPGGTEPNPWGTTYAIHFLLDAKKMGHDVAQYRINDAISWLEGYANRDLQDPQRGRYRFDRHYHRSTYAYVHYVLARGGKGRKGQAKARLARLGAGNEGWRKEARTLLQAALYLSGDRSHEGALKNPDLTPIGRKRRNGWSFYSDLRARSLSLAVISDLFPKHQGGEKMALVVANRLKRASRWYSTQELAWAMTGLGLRLGAGGDLGTVKLSVAGKNRKVSHTGPLGPSWDIWRASESGEITVNLQGGKGKRYAVIRSDGIRKDATWVAGDKGLSVRRKMQRQDGSSFDPSGTKVRLGEVINIQLTLVNNTNEDQENIALVDRLPAGFEIEAASSLRGFRQRGKRQWNIAHRNTRDDRMELFGRLRRRESVEFSYTVRAVSAGQFRQPPVEAEAMYNPDLTSRQLGSMLTITGPWQTDID